MLNPEELIIVQGILAQGEKVYGKVPCERLRWGFEAAANPNPEVAFGPEESRFCIPGLIAQAWHEPANFEAARILEASSGVIRGELRQILDSRHGFQPYDEGEGEFTAAGLRGGWNVFYFRWSGRDVERGKTLCPQTAHILEALPDYANDALFSALNPGVHLPAHCGPTNVTVKLHLGLIIPEGCGLRVGTETRCWQEGSCLAFDDSIEHEAWNRSDRTRIVLLVEVWHPDLSAAEKSLLREIFLGLDSVRNGTPSPTELHRDKLDGERWWK